MRKRVLSRGLAILLVTVLWSFLNSRNSIPSSVTDKQSEYKDFHYAYFGQRDFYTGITNPEPVEPVKKRAYGAIVSHHFFVEREITKLFKILGYQRPTAVVILGPNHFNAGNDDILISNYPYKTPWGVLEPDKDAIRALMEKGIVKNEEGPFEKEHSISTLVGFIKHEFPNTKLVPIIIKRNIRQEKMDRLVLALSQVLPKASLVVASVDFSHHVDNRTAQRQDRASIEMIKNFDYGRIWQRTAEELDSPPAIYALLKFVEECGAKSMVYTNTNQALVSGNLDSKDVTSYVFAYFTK